MRILHLAYEDPAQPGSGGGSVRTYEINRRLSQRHEITALVSGYRGAKARIEEGIRWVPIGTRFRYLADRLSYFALLGPMMRRYDFDLVVEDFGAPFSVGFSPLFTRKPVVASVQWLFADEMRVKYHLPFDKIEAAGLPHYDDFIVVSDWLGEQVRARRPNSQIETIPNGIEPMAFLTESRPPAFFLFVGRLDLQQKGCDLLLAAYALARQREPALPFLRIVGDGPAQEVMMEQAVGLGIKDAVQFCGRVTGAEKYQLMAEAYAVLMPSRFETFGMVAVEAQAAGSPVITFDVGPLREVAGPGGARLVQPFDTDAFAEEILCLFHDQSLLMMLRDQGRRWARRYDWDVIAQNQEQHYLRALE